MSTRQDCLASLQTSSHVHFPTKEAERRIQIITGIFKLMIEILGKKTAISGVAMLISIRGIMVHMCTCMTIFYVNVHRIDINK